MKVSLIASVDFLDCEYDDLYKAAAVLERAEKELKSLKENGVTPLTDDIKFPPIVKEIFEHADAIVNWLNE